MGKLKIEKFEDGLVFDWPKESEEAQDLFFEGLDYLNEGEVKKARNLFNQALEKFPEHIDVLHHLAITSENEKEMKVLNDMAVEIGMQLISKYENLLIRWGWIENRPFLRAYYHKGLMTLKDGKTDEAIKIFNQLLLWNPNDNQGARDILADIYVNNNLWEEMIELEKKYPGDFSPEINFGVALALYKLNKEDADKKLKDAIKNFPKCAKILLKDNPKKPKQVMEGYISVGGDDQAYEFWESFGKLWKEEKLREWLGESLAGE